MKRTNNLKSDKDFTDKYFRILSPVFPDFLNDYIETPALQRLKPNSISCGCNYTDMFDLKFKYSNLSHSIGVALIIWHFTGSKTQTLAGLFHDLANPSFKHCIDFMNGDHEKQTSIDERQEELLLASTEIQKLLKRDDVKTEDVVDYQLYPIADNETPQLSSDRLEYTLSNGYFWKPVWDFEDISEIYNDLTILKNENGVDELGFKSLKIAEKFIDGASQLWPLWIDEKDRATMQFIADTVAKVNKLGLISIDDLYEKSEDDLIKVIKSCGVRKIEKDFEIFQNLLPENCHGSETEVKDKYCRQIKAKRRYIIPLVKTKNGAKRIIDLSLEAKQQIDAYLNKEYAKYIYLDIDETKINDDVRLVSELTGDTYRNSTGSEISVVKITNDVLMTTKEMARMFGVGVPTVHKKIAKIFNSKELNKKQVSSILTQKADDGKLYRTTFYNGQVIIRVGSMLKSAEAEAFQGWLSKKVTER